MIEILGYGISVAIITILLSAPGIMVFYHLALNAIERTTGSEEIAQRIVSKIWRELPTDSEIEVLFNRFEINGSALVGIFICSCIYTAFMIGIPLKPDIYESWSSGVIYLINAQASFAAPFIGWISVMIVLYYGGTYISRHIYIYYQKISHLTKGNS